MPDTANKPVIFLAFANDRDDTVGYLRNLPNEARRLREVLEPAVQAGLCEVVVRSNSTAGDIFKVFQDPGYRNRIAIFHYGGHANGYQLLLESASGESAAADAGGLAEFLAQQQGLQLVFLNGCSTQEQTDGLLEANIPAVISTSRAIDDQVATDFSHQFYQGLASGTSVRTAFNEAAAAARTAKGGSTRGMYFAGAGGSQSTPAADRWPWNLYLREGSESADQWNLPEAVNDPLFGLPPLPVLDLPESPYRHLNWFTRKDAEVFFGRGHQIRELFDRLTATGTAPIVLFYGQSGVGKSSILDAGLIPRLERDYEVRYLRRTEGGLLETLQLAFVAEGSDQPVASLWQLNEAQTGKPLIVFLDQVEELYTHPVAGFPEELNKFLVVVKSTFSDPHQRPQGKLVLGFRKEWLAELESHLAEYKLPRTKVFLEPLNRRGIVEVVQGPTRSERLRKRYGLSVEEGLAEIIADDLLEDRDSAIAPTLQILLTKLWTKAAEENYEQPHFSLTLYQDMKRDGILLRDFLNQQISKFRESFPEAVDSGLLLDIVALHTTALGTAGKCSLEQLQQQYAHLGATLQDLLQQCQDLHLLTVATTTRKDGEKITRLAHDTLAPLVRERFDESDKPGQRARRILDNRSVDWKDNKDGTPLDEADLVIVEQGASGTRALNATERRLLEASRELRARLQRTRRILKFSGIAALLVIIVFAGFAAYQWQVAEKANVKAQDQARIATAGEWVTKDPTKAALVLLEIEKPEEAPRALQLMSKAAQRLARIELKGHDNAITSVAYSRNGKKIVTTSEDKTARIWSADTGAKLHRLEGHSNYVWSARFDRCGDRVVTASEDKTARIWNADGTPVVVDGGSVDSVVLEHEHIVKSAAFDPDGKRIVTASGNKARLWNADGTPLRGSDGQQIELCHSRSKDGTGCGDNTEYVVHYAVFNCDGSRIVTATNKNQAWLWNADGSTKIPIVVFGEQQHDQELVSAEFGPSASTLKSPVTAPCTLGERIVTASRDHTARLWNADGTPLLDEDAREVVVREANEVYSAVFSPSGAYILTASKDGTARLWKTKDGKPETDWGNEPKKFQHSNEVNRAVFSPSGDHIVTASKDRSARIWNHHVPPEPQLFSKAGALSAILGPTGMPVIAGVGWGENGKPVVWVWDTGTDKDDIVLTGHGGAINTIDFSAYQNLIVTASNDKTARVWNAVGSDNVILNHDDKVESAAFDHDGKRIVTASGNKARLWNTDGSKRLGSNDLQIELLHLQPEETDDEIIVNHATFSPDGTKIVTSSNDNTARVWNADGSGDPVMLNRCNNVISAAFSDSGEQIVTTCEDNTAWLWTVDGKHIRTLAGHATSVSTASFSPDGDRLVTGATDMSARIWNVPEAREPLLILNHDGYVNSAVFNSNGDHVLTTSLYNDARIWAVTYEALGARIRDANTICLDEEFRKGTLREGPSVAKDRFELCQTCTETFSEQTAEAGSIRDAFDEYRRCLSTR